MKKLLAILILAAAISNAHAWSVSGHVSGGTGLALRFVMAIPAAFDTFYATAAIPILNTYSFSSLPDGDYFLMAFQDVNGNQQPEITEPRGMYGGTFALDLSVHQNWTSRDISIGTPTAGCFDGHLSYSGTQSNFSLIGVFDNPQCTGAIHGGGFLLDHSGNGDYFTFLTGPGTYYVYAILDVNGSYQWDAGEPVGYYGGMVRAPVVITASNFPHGVNITMTDLPLLPPAPQISHDPLCDQVPAAFTVTAIVTDPYIPFSVQMWQRRVGDLIFNPQPMTVTGNPNEYAAMIAALPESRYEYYLSATDIYGGVNSTELNTFSSGALIGTELAYDDGSAESFNWSSTDPGFRTQWAVKFGPVVTPFWLYGARFAVSRSLPDAMHSSVNVQVYGVGDDGLPGDLLFAGLKGSIGNVVGGPLPGTNWANVVLRNESGNPLILNSSEFYLAVSNPDVTMLDAFGNDTNGPSQHRSYLYNPCSGRWSNEDDTENGGHPGNRLIRATGFSLASPTVVIHPVINAVELDWNNLGAPYYRVYCGASASNTGETYLGSVATTSYIDSTNTGLLRRFYSVTTSTTP
jgi:hypothetical protein